MSVALITKCFPYWATPENEVKMLLKFTFTKLKDSTFINSSHPFKPTLGKQHYVVENTGLWSQTKPGLKPRLCTYYLRTLRSHLIVLSLDFFPCKMEIMVPHMAGKL